ncbi:hypothetical protein FE257_011187 [Aspergillus nanangensis]|uniref:Uncharacterized protein n=1 Tax=Aspergillus nanangensis TaxID=2582783 RepID=A0AAD4CI80_ASPNN|nr:hypothetical protein FE257_011187 [Aspergillus nanangensis]
MSPSLYPGETLVTIAGHPTIYHYSSSSNPPSPNKPLLVLIPGSLHLARIFYGGHPTSSPTNFLTHHLNQQGYDVLSLSYPLETKPPLMPTAASNTFRIPDWGHQAALTTQKVLQETTSHPTTTTTTRPIVLIAWSMAGRMVVPFTVSARALGLDVRLCIGFAATPGFSAIRPVAPGIVCSGEGFFTVPARVEDFCAQIREMEEGNGCGEGEGGSSNGGEIIPREVYLRDYVGGTPINLIGLRLKYDSAISGFVRDEVAHEDETRVLEMGLFPMISAVYPTGVMDASHAIADRATWGFLLTYKLEAMIGEMGGWERFKKKKKKGSKETWEKLVRLVHEAPDRLCMSAPGNHFFFVGERAAREVAAQVDGLVEEAAALEKELREFFI